MKILAENTSLISAIKPLHYVSSVFGLAYFSVLEGKQHRCKSTIPRSLIWTCMWIILYSASSYLQLSSNSNSGNTTKITVLNTVQATSLNVTCIISLCMCSVFRRHQIFQIINELELMTNTFTKTVNVTTTYRKTKILVLLEIIFVLLVNGILAAIYIGLYNSRDLTIWTGLSLVIELLGCVCVSLIIIQVATVVLVLRDKCKCINRFLMRASEDDLKHPMTMFQTCKAVEFLYVDTYILPSQLHRNRLSRNQVFECRLILAELKSVSRIICSFYGFPILLLSFWMFINIVTVLHSIFYYQSTFYDNDDYSGLINSFESMLWCVYCAMLMTLMTLSCHLASEEPNITMSHVQNLLLYQNLGKETIEELIKFYSQLSETNIEITASGFFVLNLQLLYEFFGTTFAYFVIMVQVN